MQGGCFCGRIRYRIDPAAGKGVRAIANCHCTMCRRTSAAPYVSWLVVDGDAFQFTQGEPRTLRSSDKGRRQFCAECGTPLTCVLTDQPNTVDVTLCSLDAPELFTPGHDVHTDTRLPWVAHEEA